MRKDLELPVRHRHLLKKDAISCHRDMLAQSQLKDYFKFSYNYNKCKSMTSSARVFFLQ